MTEKTNFIKAFNRLEKNDGPIVMEIIKAKCKLGSSSLFYMKMRDPAIVGRDKSRPIMEYNHRGVNEVIVIESVFKCFGLDAWTGERLTPHIVTHESPPV